MGGRWGRLSGGLSGKEDKSTRVEKYKSRKRVGARVGVETRPTVRAQSRSSIVRTGSQRPEKYFRIT